MSQAGIGTTPARPARGRADSRENGEQASFRPVPARRGGTYFFGIICLISAWLALIVAAPFCTPSLLVSTEKVSEPILMVATPPLTAVTSPISAPVLSF